MTQEFVFRTVSRLGVLVNPPAALILFGSSYQCLEMQVFVQRPPGERGQEGEREKGKVEGQERFLLRVFGVPFDRSPFAFHPALHWGWRGTSRGDFPLETRVPSTSRDRAKRPL
jgi:hypothetical protein